MESNESQPKSLKDLKAGEEYDFENVELIRGQTPDDIKDKCLVLCKDYLADNWINQTVDTIIIRRITGGLSNQLYYCGIAEPSAVAKAPQEVAIRLYGYKWYNNLNSDGSARLNNIRDERFSDIITSLLLSEKNLGPKVYGLFEDGQIIHYYQHRQFKLEEQNNPILVEELFRKIARVHAMDVPLPKRLWFMKEIDINYSEAMSRFPINELIDKMNCQTMKDHDIKTEIEWLKSVIVKVDSPLMFTHNDLLSSNILVLNESSPTGDQLLICDYEYAGYNYRGCDLGMIINEWGRLWNDFHSQHTFIDDCVIKQLLYYYINESESIFGKSWSKIKVNSMDQLVKEVKVFALVYKIFMILFCLKTDDKADNFPMDKNLMMELGEKEYKNYWRIKNQFIKQNVFD